MSLRARGMHPRRRGARRGRRVRRRWRQSACGVSALVAPVAVRVRRSPPLSLRISPTVIARIASARSAPAPVAIAIGVANEALSCCTSIVRPAFAARLRAAAICSRVRGLLDSTSQPLATRCQPWRRRPSRVTNEDGRSELASPAPRTSRLSILWTFVTATSRPVAEVQDDELIGGDGRVGQEVCGGIDRRGVDSEVPEQGRCRDVKARCEVEALRTRLPRETGCDDRPVALEGGQGRLVWVDGLPQAGSRRPDRDLRRVGERAQHFLQAGQATGSATG